MWVGIVSVRVRFSCVLVLVLVKCRLAYVGLVSFRFVSFRFVSLV